MGKRKPKKGTSVESAKAFAARLRRGRKTLDIVKLSHATIRRAVFGATQALKDAGSAIGRNPKRTVAIAAGIALCAALALFTVTRPRMPTLAFYRVPDGVRDAILKEAEASPAFADSDFRTIILDDSRALSAQTKRIGAIQLLFVEDGYAAERLASRSDTPPAAVAKSLPISFRKSATAASTENKGTAYGLPLLADHFEIAWPKALFGRLSLPPPQTTDSFLSALRATSGEAKTPLICAGSDDRELLLLVSALLSARFGPAGRERLVTALRDGASFSEALASTRLRDVLSELVAWRESRTLHPEWLKFRERDLHSFLSEEYAAMTFLSFSAHRNVPVKTIVRYESQFFPQASLTAGNELVAPVYIGMALDSGPRDSAARDFLYSLAEPKPQARLASRTGLAPVTLLADAQDRQAADVRYWIAASSRAIPDIATASYDDPKKIDDLAREIRTYLEMNGTGY